jgi:hypothetical protein
MATYGCWDCGSEVPPFQGRCAVCGWPAPPPRRRRRVPKILLLAFLAGLVALGGLYVMSRIAVPSVLHVRTSGRHHKWVAAHSYYQGDALSGTVYRCENCGARSTGYLLTKRCPGPEETRR